jgi:DNA-binding CsgD family transcriptional regulator/ketosteroid isomerase-like protein
MNTDVDMGSDADKAAVLAVLNAENAAFMRQDLDAWAEHWVHSPQSRFMSSHAYRGSRVLEGWDAIRAFIELGVREIEETYDETRVHLERMNVVINGDTAWATYDQVGDGTDDNFYMVGTYHQLQIFHRIADQWKIACIVVIHRATDHEICPLIEVAPDKRVLWTNDAAHKQISKHPALIITGGRLRARNRNHESKLQEAVNWANQLTQRASRPTPAGRLARAVILGESEDAVPALCWVLVEDGRILVSFNDEQLIKRRIAIAQGIYGISAAQAELAMLVVKGHELSVAAEMLGVSINTVRTHLQRMFERTGTHSQSALVGLLLSADAPTAI